MTPARQPHPQYKVNFHNKMEVLCDGEHFATTTSHLHSIRIVMAMETVHKQMDKATHTSPPAPGVNGDVDGAYMAGFHDGEIQAAKDAREKTIEEIWMHIHPFCDPMTEDYLKSLRAQQQGGVSE